MFAGEDMTSIPHPYVYKNAVAGTTVYDPDGALTATDPDADDTSLSYTVSGTDAMFFDMSTGQLKTGTGFDGTKDSYTVNLTVTDGDGLTDIIGVTIMVEAVTAEENEKPEFTDGATATRTIVRR